MSKCTNTSATLLLPPLVRLGSSIPFSAPPLEIEPLILTLSISREATTEPNWLERSSTREKPGFAQCF